MTFATLSHSHFVQAMKRKEVDRVERETQTDASFSEDSDSAAEAAAMLKFGMDVRGWTTIHVPIAKAAFRVKSRGKIIEIPVQQTPVLIAVNPVHTAPDEWTSRGVTVFILSRANLDEYPETVWPPTGGLGETC